MFVEAIRTYLASLGIAGVEDWSPDEIMQHVDAVFQEYMVSPETFRDMANEFWENVRLNMFTVTGVLIGTAPDYNEHFVDPEEDEPYRIYAIPKRTFKKTGTNPLAQTINDMIQYQELTDETSERVLASDMSQIELKYLIQQSKDNSQ